MTPNSTDWQRFSVTQVIGGSGATSITAEILPGNGSTSTIYAWGAQLVQASSPQVYVRSYGHYVAPSTGVVSNGGAYISADNSSDIPLVVAAAPSQSGDLFDLQNSSATVLAGFTAAGNLNVASAVDTELASGTLSLGTSNATTVDVGKTTGTVNLQSATVTAGVVGSSLFTNNGATNNAPCAESITANTTWVAASTVNICTAFDVATSGATPWALTLPTPASGAGAIIYISNLGSSTQTFTINGDTLNIGSTASMVYNGAAWTFAGADASTLQTAYNASGGSQPQIEETSGGKGVEIADASSTNGTIFAVGSNGMAATYLGVSNSAVTLTDNLGFTATSAGNGTYSISVANQTTAGQAGDKLTVLSASGAAGSGATAGGAGGQLEQSRAVMGVQQARESPARAQTW